MYVYVCVWPPRCRQLIKDAFDSEVQYLWALDAGCRTIVNRPVPRRGGGGAAHTAPDLLAKYCDLCLKKSKHFTSDGEIEEKMNALIIIFQYVDDKDIFQKFYSKMLAKRLIHGTSASDEAEVCVAGIEIVWPSPRVWVCVDNLLVVMGRCPVVAPPCVRVFTVLCTHAHARPCVFPNMFLT